MIPERDRERERERQVWWALWLSRFIALRESPGCDSWRGSPRRAWRIMWVKQTEPRVWGDAGVKRSEYWSDAQSSGTSTIIRCLTICFDVPFFPVIHQSLGFLSGKPCGLYYIHIFSYHFYWRVCVTITILVSTIPLCAFWLPHLWWGTREWL